MFVKMPPVSANVVHQQHFIVVEYWVSPTKIQHALFFFRHLNISRPFFPQMTCPSTRALWSSIFLNPASTSTTSQALGPPRRTISGAQSVATWVSYASCFTTAWSFFREKSMSLASLCDLFGMVKWPPNRDQKVTVWITWSLSWDEVKQPMRS